MDLQRITYDLLYGLLPIMTNKEEEEPLCGPDDCFYEHLPKCCKFPTCRDKEYQEKLAAEIYDKLVGGS